MNNEQNSQRSTNDPQLFDNFGKRGRVKSIIRDASFWPAFLGVWARAAGGSLKGSSVTKATPTANINANTANINANTATITATSARSPLAVPPKLDRFMRSRPKGSPIAFRVPARWSDLSLPFQALYFHWVAAGLGQVNAFTLRLDADVEAQARGDGAGAADFLRRRIARQLQQAAGRHVEFWFVLENAKTGGRGLHVHGEMVASTDELPALRKALRAAGGEWSEARQHQAHTGRKPADAGWIGYITSEDVLTRKHRKVAGSVGAILSMQRGFDGSNHYVGRQLRSAANRLYDRDRAAVIRALTS